MASGCRISTIHAQCQTLITVGAPIKALEMLSFLNRNKALYVIEDFLPLSGATTMIIPTDCSEGFGMSIDW